MKMLDHVSYNSAIKGESVSIFLMLPSCVDVMLLSYVAVTVGTWTLGQNHNRCSDNLERDSEIVLKLEDHESTSSRSDMITGRVYDTRVYVNNNRAVREDGDTPVLPGGSQDMRGLVLFPKSIKKRMVPGISSIHIVTSFSCAITLLDIALHIRHLSRETGDVSMGDKVTYKVNYDYERRKLLANNHTCTYVEFFPEGIYIFCFL
ncbi:hypothetical protein ISN44_As11g028510 [Arabidopsis suecica]|uniref:Uncharacterized protein n=1 Tax=Arabidopsis suecica TaxID=45249 RepID=A0A8T1ZF76_ARASU|nr:hypothetical protein ISN44_As11g028510 [Arabidopsis suecica]